MGKGSMGALARVGVRVGRWGGTAGLCGGASVLAMLASAGQAVAQAQPASTGAPAAQTLEEVVVTGTRIRNSDVTSAAPIAVVTERQVQAAGAVNVALILNRMPEFGSQSAQEQAFANSTGVSSVELRNLGPVRTLVLVNGQRMTPSGGQVVDFNAIPTAMIERVEVLKDGASPVYGSDAVGGVVNVILRKKFDGALVSGQTGVSSRGDRQTYDASAMVGGSTDHASLLLGLGYSTQGAVRSIDRDFAHLSAAQGGQTIRATPAVGRYYVRSGPNAGYYVGTAAGGYQAASTSDPIANLNVGDLIYIVDPQRRANITASGEYDVSPTVKLYADGLYANSQPQHQAAIYPIGDAYVTSKWPTGLYVPATLPDGSANPYNPFGQNLGLRYAPMQLGQRLFRNNYNTFQIRLGARGSLRDTFDWDIGYTYGESDHELHEDNAVNFTHAAQLLGMIPCTAQEVAAGCVLTNFAGGKLTAAQLKYLAYTAVSTDQYSQDFWHANIDGPILSLPAGKLRFAAGVESRREAYRADPDALQITGDYYGGASFPTKGDYRVNEGYVEFEAPILRDAPFAKKLDFDAATRVSSYTLSRVGTVVTWKVGGVYSPVSDLTFRAHYGTGIRAPTVKELFSGGTTSVLGYVDPCDLSKGIAGATAIANCQRVLSALGVNPATFRQQLAGMTTTITGSPNLAAERSTNLTAGVIMQPHWIPRLSATLDYYNINVTGAIASTSSFAQVLINQCYASPNLSSPACALFSTRQALSGGAFGTMTATNVNLGFIKTEGLDIGLNYALPASVVRLPADDRFVFEGHAAYQPKYQVQQPDGTVTDFAGVWRTAADSTAYPKWRASATLTYRASAWSVSWATRFIEGTVRQGGNASQYGVALPNVYYHDLMADYAWRNMTFNAGVRNLFDRQPPYAKGDLYTNTVTNVYDFVGRYMYVGASAKF
jgi:iron complex outermembrane recepter protein